MEKTKVQHKKMIEESRDISILKQALQRYAVENYEMAKKLRHCLRVR